MSKKTVTLGALGFLSVIAVTLLVMWPALSGPFLLDDLMHFIKISKNNAVHNSTTFWEFATSIDRTPGRFLSFVSLLIEDFAWPTQPYSYKYTNLFIHLFNGILVFCVTRLIFSRYFSVERTLIIALLSMLLWLIHPMQISTVMYVIQRMTLLSTTFILLGLLSYLHGRRVLDADNLKGLLFMSIGVGFGFFVGFLFKEISVSIFLYVLVLEMVLFSEPGAPYHKLVKVWRFVFLFFPIILISSYFALNFSMLERMLERRDFNLYERTLTEFRVLVDYLGLILFPKLSELTLYHDDYVVSRSFFQPISTVISFAFIVALTVIAILLKKRFWVFSLSALWFLAGHALESTFLPIELYFEHRNYLPILGPVWLIVSLPFLAGSLYSSYLKFALAAYSCLLIFLCIIYAKTWGNPTQLAVMWTNNHPTSVRAIYDMTRVRLLAGQEEEAYKLLEGIEKVYPNKISIPLFKEVYFGCRGIDKEGITDESIRHFASAPFDLGAISGLQQLSQRVLSDQCKSIDLDKLVEIADALLKNPNYVAYSKGRASILQNIANAYIKKRDLNRAMSYMDESYNAYPTYKTPLQQAVMLASAGLYEKANDYLDKALVAPLGNKLAYFYREQRIEEVRKLVNQSIQ